MQEETKLLNLILDLEAKLSYIGFIKSGRGEVGRRARLKISWIYPDGFESRGPYQFNGVT